MVINHVVLQLLRCIQVHQSLHVSKVERVRESSPGGCQDLCWSVIYVAFLG